MVLSAAARALAKIAAKKAAIAKAHRIKKTVKPRVKKTSLLDASGNQIYTKSGKPKTKKLTQRQMHNRLDNLQDDYHSYQKIGDKKGMKRIVKKSEAIERLPGYKRGYFEGGKFIPYPKHFTLTKATSTRTDFKPKLKGIHGKGAAAEKKRKLELATRHSPVRNEKDWFFNDFSQNPERQVGRELTSAERARLYGPQDKELFRFQEKAVLPRIVPPHPLGVWHRKRSGKYTPTRQGDLSDREALAFGISGAGITSYMASFRKYGVSTKDKKYRAGKR